MRILISILFIVLFSSCSSNYKGLHNNLNEFAKDVEYCLKKSCKKQTVSTFFDFSIITPLLAYGGGGGGGGMSNSFKNQVSFKTFNLCLKDKGYLKDKNGIFKLPSISCN